MKSRSGCETCRQRKLKCDEQKPTCDRCRKAGRSCVQGSIFRHQDRPTGLNAPAVTQQHQLPVANSVDRARPHQGGSFTFVYVSDPYFDDVATADPAISRPAIASPHIAVPDDNIQPSGHAAPSPPSHLHRSPAGTHEPVAGLEAVFHRVPDPVVQHAAAIDALQQPAGLSAATQDAGFSSRASLQEGHDVQLDGTQSATADPVLSVQLVWYFKEVPGKWMDLYDVTAYFTFYVPRLTATRPLLRSACCALAFKHIRRLLESRRPGSDTRLPYLSSEFWRTNLTTRNWNYESAAYYDDAIRLFMDEIIRVSDQTDTSVDRSHRSEEALAAIAILCVYELLDAPGPEWSAHMSALPLLETAPARILDTLSPQPPPRGMSKRSIFWNFVRQDYLYAFIHSTRTRLNPDDPQFWRESGLLADDNGFLQPCRATDASNNIWLETDEDLVSHSLFWILGKIANFIAAVGELDVDGCSALSGELSYDELSSEWKGLDLGLGHWSKGLPPSFSSFVRTPLVESGADAASAGSRLNFDRITYTIPTCGSTMQNYHMARILLLMNKPPQRRALRATFTERLSSYRRIQEEAAHHSREICGISLSSPPESVRIQSVQPLFVAGQCLGELEERDMVVDLLRGIEQDLGWATGYRVQKLVEEWEACPPD